MAQLLSPLPGTFYRKPAPDKPSYKNDGDKVAKGDVIGLIEVMKSFTEVKADAAGKITFIAENEEPVMAGQPLAQNHYEMIADRALGLELGEQIPLGKDTFTVVGLTTGMIDSGGNGLAFFTALDAQTVQFDLPGAAMRLERAARRGRADRIDLSSSQPGLLDRAEGLSAAIPALAPPASPGPTCSAAGTTGRGPLRAGRAAKGAAPCPARRSAASRSRRPRPAARPPPPAGSGRSRPEQGWRQRAIASP